MLVFEDAVEAKAGQQTNEKEKEPYQETRQMFAPLGVGPIPNADNDNQPAG